MTEQSRWYLLECSHYALDVDRRSATDQDPQQAPLGEFYCRTCSDLGDGRRGVAVRRAVWRRT